MTRKIMRTTRRVLDYELVSITVGEVLAVAFLVAAMIAGFKVFIV